MWKKNIKNLNFAKIWRSSYFSYCLPHQKKTLYGPFLWLGFNCFKTTEPLQGGSLLFTTKFPEIPGTHLIDLGRIKG